MRILSNFKDYYDAGLAYGIDKSHIYERTTEEVDTEFTHAGVLGFCGKAYMVHNYMPIINLFSKIDPVILDELKSDRKRLGIARKKLVTVDTDMHNYNGTLNIQSGKHSIGELYLMKRISLEEAEEYIKKETETKQSRYMLNEVKTAKEMTTIIFPIFKEFGVPIFYCHEKNKLILNPPLVKLNFQKIMNAIQTFQEIDMFLFNEDMRPSNNPVPIGGDKVVAKSKGYNKYSFRRPKAGE